MSSTVFAGSLAQQFIDPTMNVALFVKAVEVTFMLMGYFCLASVWVEVMVDCSLGW